MWMVKNKNDGLDQPVKVRSFY